MIKQFTLIILTLFSSYLLLDTGIPECTNDSDLVGSIWYNEPNEVFPSDSLIFYSNDEARYFMGELSWSFNSDYVVQCDTLVVKTALDAFEVKDASNIEPNLIQKYIISSDSLRLIYMANKRNGKFIEADSSRYSMVNDFNRIK